MKRLLLIPKSITASLPEPEPAKAEDEKAKTAKITTAFEAADTDIEKLKQQLEKKYNCAVQVETAVDTALIGGAIIEIGDVVIDGSIKGRLDKLQHVLQA